MESHPKKRIRLISGSCNRRTEPKKRAANFPSFSDVEDTVNAYRTINELTSLAGRRAAAKRKRAGLPGTFIRNNRLLTVTQNGVEKIVSARPANANTFYIKYQPATVLHAIKK